MRVWIAFCLLALCATSSFATESQVVSDSIEAEDSFDELVANDVEEDEDTEDVDADLESEDDESSDEFFESAADIDMDEESEEEDSWKPADCQKQCSAAKNKPKCIQGCEAKNAKGAPPKKDKSAKPGQGPCEQCGDAGPAKLAACCKAKTHCEVKKLGGGVATCVAMSATDKRLTERELQQRAQSAVGKLTQAGQEWFKKKRAELFEKACEMMLSGVTSKGDLMIKLRTMGEFEQKKGVAQALAHSAASKLISLATAPLVAYLATKSNAALAVALAGVGNWMPFKNKLITWLHALVVGKVAGKGTAAVGGWMDAIALKFVEKHWARIHGTIDAGAKKSVDLPKKQV